MLFELTISGNTPWAEGRPVIIRPYVTDSTEIIGARSRREALEYYKSFDPEGYADLDMSDFHEANPMGTMRWGDCEDRNAERITLAEAIRRMTREGCRWPEQIASAYC